MRRTLLAFAAVSCLAAPALAGPAEDAMIAATALTHELMVVTRNVKDFEGFGVKTVDPFAAR